MIVDVLDPKYVGECIDREFTLGIDFHGVIDHDPYFWSKFTNLMCKNYNIIIITGHTNIEELQDELEELDIYYDDIFSIAQYHRSIGTPMVKGTDGSVLIKPEIWDVTKADYCRRNKIDLHIDDSEEYLKYFTTPYIHYTH